VSDYETTQKRRDVVVGIFVIVGLGALGWMILKFGDLPTAVTRMRSFEVYVQFPTAPGVMKDTPVRFCGYQIGRVTAVMPPEVREDLNTRQRYHQSLCVLSINKKYSDIPSNVEVKLMTRGLGSSYLELAIDPNDLPAPPRDPNDLSTRFLQNGMALQGSTGMTSEFFPEESQEMLKRLVSKIDGFITDTDRFIVNADKIVGDEKNRQNFQKLLANLSGAAGDFNDVLRPTMAKVDKALTDFSTLAVGTDAKAERFVTSVVATSNELGKSFAQLRLALERVNAGQGSAGQFMNDGRLYESLLENTTQLNIVLKDFKALIDKISEKGLRSIY
jgi:ABC-type transporter Mla subunit MlaD